MNIKTWVAMGAFALALRVCVLPAAAQDRSTYDWTGFYLGGGAGYAWGGITHSFGPGAGGFGPPGMWAPDATGSAFTDGGNGGLYGFHAGYLHQWDHLVGGVEASFD